MVLTNRQKIGLIGDLKAQTGDPEKPRNGFVLRDEYRDFPVSGMAELRFSYTLSPDIGGFYLAELRVEDCRRGGLDLRKIPAELVEDLRSEYGSRSRYYDSSGDPVLAGSKALLTVSDTGVFLEVRGGIKASSPYAVYSALLPLAELVMSSRKTLK